MFRKCRILGFLQTPKLQKHANSQEIESSDAVVKLTMTPSQLSTKCNHIAMADGKGVAETCLAGWGGAKKYITPTIFILIVEGFIYMFSIGVILSFTMSSLHDCKERI